MNRIRSYAKFLVMSVLVDQTITRNGKELNDYTIVILQSVTGKIQNMHVSPAQAAQAEHNWEDLINSYVLLSTREQIAGVTQYDIKDAKGKVIETRTDTTDGVYPEPFVRAILHKSEHSLGEAVTAEFGLGAKARIEAEVAAEFKARAEMRSVNIAKTKAADASEEVKETANVEAKAGKA